MKYDNAKKKLRHNACNEATKRHQECKGHCKFKIDIHSLIELCISLENCKLLGKKLNKKVKIILRKDRRKHKRKKCKSKPF